MDSISADILTHAASRSFTSTEASVCASLMLATVVKTTTHPVFIDTSTSGLYFCRKTGTPSTTTMATRKTTILQPGGRARRGRRILGALFFFVACVLVVDALVGDQGLLATIRARRQYNQLGTDLTRLRDENA